MSESTTKSAKGATKPKAEKKSEAKSETKSGSGAESAPAEKPTAVEKSTKSAAAADNSPSYFSSVSTPKYRSGWDSVFSSNKRRKKA